MNIKKTVTTAVAGVTVIAGSSAPLSAYALPVVGWTKENLSVIKEQNARLDFEKKNFFDFCSK